MGHGTRADTCNLQVSRDKESKRERERELKVRERDSEKGGRRHVMRLKTEDCETRLLLCDV